MYQFDPPPIPKSLLPTMYDLPSEDPEEPGFPDQFHSLQLWLLKDTFRPSNYPSNKIFTCGNINFYYDWQHTMWHKRPDWIAVVGVDRLYEQRELRLSYVIWQEQVRPLIVVEFLAVGVDEQELSMKSRDAEQEPGKLEVYERFLQIPYYVVFDRFNCVIQLFQLEDGQYIGVGVENQRFWIPEIELGLGVWWGEYDRTGERHWLRWYDVTGNWILYPGELTERADAEKERADAERQEKEILIARLRSLGVDPDLI